ncbi:hypothetical protein MIND_01380800 [Mycena indigotica]|uniref:F-box domain-containing protein n=1 Tax=Mycena indigotica TaxID=2126181 RepID=A0A8H6RZE7_9AGAR|nr:uncharacterized protein MIND_01380800 [Mycena indigotica]KAF7289196.1 hypothetical protein MIND_01380800 [Mycena indigotica]
MSLVTPTIPDPRLPPELLHLICDLIDSRRRALLLNLCKVSRVFRVPSQRKLYERVDLAGCSVRVILYWCLVIRRRQDLSERVWRLRLLAPTTHQVYTEEADKIFLAVSRCVNITWLELPYEVPGAISSPHWLLGAVSTMRSPFRLTVFECGAHSQFHELRSVLLQQPSLLFLILGSKDIYLDRHFLRRLAEAGGQDPKTVLPSLFAVKTLSPNVQIERRLRRIETMIGDITPLARYASSLQVLNIHFGSSRDLQVIATLARVAQLFPRLQYLALVEAAQKLDDCWYTEQDSPALVMPRFQNLRSLYLVLSRVTQLTEKEPDGSVTRAVPVGDEVGMRELCLKMMNAAPDTCLDICVNIIQNEDGRFAERSFRANIAHEGARTSRVKVNSGHIPANQLLQVATRHFWQSLTP